jgi:hypothetical protein
MIKTLSGERERERERDRERERERERVFRNPVYAQRPSDLFVGKTRVDKQEMIPIISITRVNYRVV